MREKFWMIESDYSKENNEIKEERIEKIKREIANLSKRRKEIINLNYEEGQSYKEIANQLNISINTVKNQLIIMGYPINTRDFLL